MKNFVLKNVNNKSIFDKENTLYKYIGKKEDLQI